MGKIKSAFEVAMEKVQNLKVSEEEIEKMEFVSRGRALGARFLDEAALDLEAELSAHPDQVKAYLIEGIEETLLNNIRLPEDEVTDHTTRTAMEAIGKLKEDKRAVGEILSQIEHLFHYYAQALRQAFNEARNNFDSKRAELVKALEQQYGGRVQGIEQAAFQELWQRAKNGLNAQYEPLLEEQKQKIRNIKY